MNRPAAIVRRRRTGFICVLAVLGCCASAGASEAPRRLAIGSFRGPQAARIQDAVQGALLGRYFLVSGAQVAAAARKSGVTLGTDSGFGAVGRTLNVDAFVNATVFRQKNWRVQMVVRRGDTGAAMGRFEWSDRSLDLLASALARVTPKKLHALLSTTPDVFETEARDAPSVKRAADDEPASADAPSFLEMTAGGRVFTRTLSYTDNVSQLPGYRLGRASAVSMDLALYPVTAFNPRLRSGLALTGSVSYALGVGTSVQGVEGSSAHTEVYGYEGGVGYRIALGVVELSPHGAYFIDNFATGGTDSSTDVRYRVAKVGTGFRLALGSRASVNASGDYLHVLSAGPMTSEARFGRATVRGVDVGLGASFAFANSVEVHLSLGLRRYGFAMHSRPGDALVVGGAIDEYLSMGLGLTYRPSLQGH